MLIEFTVGNYRSFKDPQTLSMVATSLKSKDERVDVNNVIKMDGQPNLLTSAAIYGANASGKSNLIDALGFMRSFVLTSPRQTERTGGIEAEPFRLSLNTLNKPSFFEVVFVIEDTRYRYGFELTAERVEREWLHHVPSTREADLFVRQGDRVKVGRSFPEGKELFERTRPNALFLSVAAQFNGPVASKLLDWFSRLLFTGMDSRRRSRAWGWSQYRPAFHTQRYLEIPQRAKEINDLVQRLDLNIRGIHLDETIVQLPLFTDEEVSEVPESAQASDKAKPFRERRISTVRTAHTLYDEDDQPIGETLFEMDEQESEGTRRLFALAGPLLSALRFGRVMIVDELDARLHPLMTREIVRLFNNRQTNSHGAQIIFSTQDTNLLDNELFRRDQIWFVEKNSQGASQLYSLAEIQGVRNDLSYERGYIQGRFGAVPYLNPNRLQALLVEGDGEGA